ncbi:MAG: L,D-transpeptidase [Candidatus Aminicenantes bacterium]|nr:L,D-transpeptidase [Candidatus Aminicenantes bacterium]
MSTRKSLRILLLCVLAAFALLEAAALFVAWPRAARDGGWTVEAGSRKRTPAEIERETAALRRRIRALSPKGVHIIIDSARNTLTLKKGQEALLTAMISCGSGTILEDPSGKRIWVFDTPRGEFQVKSKLVNPTWVKPDWAFIEEGKEIPEKQEERLEDGVLGDYALGFGDGYFIHGTLYTRLLGRSVTHGCIRVGDEDLKAVYRAASIGTRIYIY